MFLFLFGFLFVVANASKPCAQREFLFGRVCVCNATYCDDLGKVEPPEDGTQILAVETEPYWKRFTRTTYEFSDKRIHERIAWLHPTQEFQSMEGFGGAFTDATVININSLDDAVADNLMNAYFGESGMEYHKARVPIGSTHFSTHAYSYDDDDDEDPNLENFKLAAEDLNLKIPLIKKAIELSNNNLELIASSWTAPTWMKTTGSYLNGKIKPHLYQTWTDYHLRFLEEYAKAGIDFWAITTGNQPSLAKLPFNKINSVGWTSNTMHKFVKEHFGPTLRNSSFSDIKILLLDDYRFFLPWWPSDVLKDGAENFIDGIALHWELNNTMPPTTLNLTHDLFPSKFLLNTQSFRGYKFLGIGVLLGHWDRAAQYALAIMEDLKHWVTGWIDWNMVLDRNGGPTYVINNVDAPIIVDASVQEFYKQPMYYYLAHFAKFIPKHSVRMHTTQYYSEFEVVAFTTPENNTAIVILNPTPWTEYFTIHDPRKGYINMMVDANSMVSLLYKN